MDHAPGSPGPQQLPLPAKRFFEDLGSQVAAPLLGGMLQWVAGCLRENPPDVLLFFSRDGQILHRLWEKLPGKPTIPTHYVHASRRCLRIAAMDQIGDLELEFLTSHTGNLSVEDVFLRAGLTPKDLATIVEKHPQLPADELCSRVETDVLKAAFRDLSPALLENAEKERSAYRQYLKSIGLDKLDRIAVVDVGWHGSLQEAFGKILKTEGSDTQLEGYYAGLFEDTAHYRKDGNQMSGFLLHDGGPDVRYREMQMFLELIEFFFSANERGLLHMRHVGGEVQPVYAAEDTTHWQQAAISSLQEGILSGNYDAVQSPEVIYERLRRIGLFPHREEARWIGRLQEARGFGQPRMLQRFAARGSAVTNLLHWKGFVARFKEALWRPGFHAQLSWPERVLLKKLSPEGIKRLQAIRNGVNPL